jgi:hypothetical protein
LKIESQDLELEKLKGKSLKIDVNKISLKAKPAEEKVDDNLNASE